MTEVTLIERNNNVEIKMIGQRCGIIDNVTEINGLDLLREWKMDETVL